jgi:Integrase core domain
MRAPLKPQTFGERLSAKRAFVEHREGGAVSELRSIEVRLTALELNDGVGGPLPLRRSPQSQLGNRSIVSTHFTDPAGETWSPTEIKEMIAERRLFHAHAFEYACALNDIDHRVTKPKHPWTNGQVERMNRTIKDATVRRYFYETHDQLRAHLRDFVDAYNLARRLKTLRGLTPYEFVCKAWTSQPQRFIISPLQKMPGLNT